MLRLLLCIATLGSTVQLMGQSTNQTFDAANLTELKLEAKLSEVVLVAVEGNEIEIAHTFIVNGEPIQDISELSYTEADGRAVITEVSPTMEQIEERWQNSGRVLEVNGQQFQNEVITSVLEVRFPSWLDIEIETEYGAIKGENLSTLTRANSKYGVVELVFDERIPHEDLVVFSKYGEVDITLPENLGADLVLTTEYGNLLSDFDLDIDTDRSEEEDHLQHVEASMNGGGSLINCTATYSNIYVRKAK
ncbi:MAG: hypothetical protein AAF544_08495 [Bacteroidota bacterium]